MRSMNPEEYVLKRVSLDWWAVLAALASVALVKAINLTVGW
jgi:hypothetical protein